MIADGMTNVVFLADMLKVRFPSLFAQLQSTLTSHGVEVRLLNDVRDIWARDYCPIQAAPGRLVQFRYEPDYLEKYPDERTGRDVARQFQDLGECEHSEVNLDGGNVVTSGTMAILTNKIYPENPTRNRVRLRDELRRVLQVEQVIMLPQEKLEPFGHTDAMVRFVDEHTVLLNDYAKVDSAFGERLFKALRRHRLAVELVPYVPENRSRAGIPSAVGCYTNFLRTEKVLVAPIYGTKHDHVALRKLEAVFPGFPIVPLDCTDLARKGGVANCISATYHVSSQTP